MIATKVKCQSNLQEYLCSIFFVLFKLISFKQTVLFVVSSSFHAAWSKRKIMHCSQLKMFSVTIFFQSLPFTQFWIRIHNFPARSSCLLLIGFHFLLPSELHREKVLYLASLRRAAFPGQIVYLMKKIEEWSTLFVWSYINIFKREDFLIYSTLGFLLRESFKCTFNHPRNDNPSYNSVIIPNIFKTLEMRKVKWNSNSELLSTYTVMVGLSHMYIFKTSLSL